jgi:hypothetical protein
MIDVDSRYTFLRGLRRINATHMAEVLLDILSEYGFPKQIQSDNATEVINESIEQILKMEIEE